MVTPFSCFMLPSMADVVLIVDVKAVVVIIRRYYFSVVITATYYNFTILLIHLPSIKHCSSKVSEPCIAFTHLNTSSRKELCTSLVEMKGREKICKIKKRECDSYKRSSHV